MNAAELAEQHLYLADACTAKFVSRLPLHADRGAFRGAALEALVRAAQQFDAARGVTFATFVWARMWWAMTDENRNLDWHSRLERERGQTLDGQPLYGAPLSLDKEQHTMGEDGATLGDLVQARGGDFADTACSRLDLLAALAEIPVRQRKVLLASMVGAPQAEVAGEMGVSCSRVSQIEGRARRQLVEKVAA